MDTDHVCILSPLRHHLLLLDRADTVLRIEYDNAGSRHISKPGQSCLTRISGGCGQDNDLIFDVVLPGTGGKQIRKDGQSHILKCDGSSMEQLQKP